MSATIVLALFLLGWPTGCAPEPTTSFLRKGEQEDFPKYGQNYSSEESIVKEASCRDISDDFNLHNQGVKINCGFLDRDDYQFACTWSEVREMCPVTCNSCLSTYEPDDDFISEYETNDEKYTAADDDKITFLDDKIENRFDDDGTAVYTFAPSPPCNDFSRTFKIKRYGDRISCSDLLTEKYAYGCTWRRVQLKCPETCNSCGRQSDGNVDNYDDFLLPSDAERDDDVDGISKYDDDDLSIMPVVPHRCLDDEGSFRLRKNGSTITCRDLLKSRYRLACTWERFRKICPDTCSAC